LRANFLKAKKAERGTAFFVVGGTIGGSFFPAWGGEKRRELNSSYEGDICNFGFWTNGPPSIW
jgi:hypothetical protein